MKKRIIQKVVLNLGKMSKCRLKITKQFFSVTEIKFHLQFDGFISRHHGFGRVWFCGHFRPDETETKLKHISKIIGESIEIASTRGEIRGNDKHS